MHMKLHSRHLFDRPTCPQLLYVKPSPTDGKISGNYQWRSQNLNAKAATVNPQGQSEAWTFEAKAKVFKQMARAKIKICGTSDKIGDEPNFDCSCSGIHLLLITYKLVLIYYYNF